MQGRSVVLCLGMLAVLVPVQRAWPCGPDFPPVMLQNRSGTLMELPEGTFVTEMARLVPEPGDGFRAMEEGEPEGARKGGGARETELYQAGAQAFNAGDEAQARARFLDVLGLPAEERRRFGPFAAYMLGRMAPSIEEAQRYFNEVRELVRNGSEDPLGLAVASFGEEGRVLLREGKDLEAVQRYALQAAHGSQSGGISLLWVARSLSRDEARLQRALEHALGQRLLVTYAWTRARDSWWGEEEKEQRPLPGLLEKLAAVPNLAGADKLAAAAWSAGRFDLAERFVGKEKTALDVWVRAKLELRRGRKAEADRLLSEAAEQFSSKEAWLIRFQDSPYILYPRQRVEAERGVLSLAQGQFVQAAEHLVASCSWPDLAYVAERVLKVDELRQFVASHGSLKPCPPESPWSEETVDIGPQLRELVGRRLMRVGRGREALEFFRGTPVEEKARQYVELLERGKSQGDAFERAQALYEAAVIARHSGLELLATEMSPDWGWVDAEYDLDDEERDLGVVPRGQGAPAPSGLGDNELATKAEAERWTAHNPPHSVRFHYRSTAADLAQEAATLVPPRSQAYAALLCVAAHYSSRTDSARVGRLWETYVKNGAVLKEPWSFGQQCPKPDFARLKIKQEPPKKPWRRRTVAAVAGAVLVPLALVAGGFLWMRRKKAGPGTGA